MSREIKYRVWSKNLKKYVGGMLLDQAGCLYSMELGFEISEEDAENYIVEQDTGLKDKNGKKIHEGDIVSVHHSDTLHDHNKFFGYNALVKCSLNKGGAFTIQNWYGGRILDWDIPLRFIEVIGNIHENPELLGGEE